MDPYRPTFRTEEYQMRSPFHFKSIFISDKRRCWDKEIHTCRPCLWPIKRSLVKFSQNKCDIWNELKRHSLPNIRPFHLKRIRLENHFSSFKKAVPLFQLPQYCDSGELLPWCHVNNIGAITLHMYLFIACCHKTLGMYNSCPRPPKSHKAL